MDCKGIVAYSQGNIGLEPEAKRRRIDPAAAARPLSQRHSLLEQQVSALVGQQSAQERAQMVEELVAMAKQTCPAGRDYSNREDHISTLARGKPQNFIVCSADKAYKG